MEPLLESGENRKFVNCLVDAIPVSYNGQRNFRIAGLTPDA
jgi:hypothetical protein